MNYKRSDKSKKLSFIYLADELHDDDGSRTKNNGKTKLLQLHPEFRMNGHNQRLSNKNTLPLYLAGMFDGAPERA